ncbi:MAG: PAS domain S-box protein [Candidatus Coatesbacteria bacterium]|nr:PAS domain S-box protein [Candidatus Coatesbacteria bacterium]
MKFERRIILFPLAVCGAYWLLESILDSVFLDEASFVNSLLMGISPHEMYMRLTTTGMIFLSGIVIVSISHRSKKAEKKLRHLNRVLKAIRNVTQLTNRERDRDRLIGLACKHLTETRGYYHAWVVLMDASQGFLTAAESGLSERFQALVDSLRSGKSPHCISEVMQSSDRVMLVSTESNGCKICPMFEGHSNVGAFVARLELDGMIYGVLSASMPMAIAQEREELQLFSELAGDLAFALQGIEIEQARNSAEEALKESSRFMESVFNAIQDGISVLDRELNIVRVNSWMERMYSHGRPLEGQKCYSIYQNRDTPCPWCPSLRALETTEMNTSIVPYPDIDEPTGWIELTAFPLKDAEGHVTGVIEYVKDITKQKSAQDALEESEEHLRSIIDTAVDGFVLCDLKGRIVDVNESYCQMVGYSRDELIRMSIPDIDADETPADSARHIGRIIESGGDCFQTRHRRKDGTIIDMEISARHLAVQDGRMVIFMRDITDRKLAEAALRESESRYRSVFEDTQAATALIDNDGKFAMVNARLEELSGFSKDELVGKMTMLDLVTEAEQERLRAYHLERRRTGGAAPREYEFKFCDRDGNIKDMLACVGIIPGTKTSVVSILDISEHRRAEAALREAYNIVNRSPVVAFLWRNEEGWPVEYVSENVESLFGHSAVDFISGKVTYRETIHPDDLERVTSEFGISRLGRSSEGFRLEPFRIVTRDGEIRWVRSVNEIRRNEKGEITHYQGIIEDITERKRLEGRLLQAEKMEAVGRLAGGVAHDFNNILTAIIGNLELYRTNFENGSAVPDEIEEISTAATRAAELTEQLLAFSRKQIIAPKPLNLNHLIADLGNMLRRLIREDIVLAVLQEDDIPAIKADSAQIQQVIMNLALNARDAMPYGGKLTIETATVFLDEEFVRDNPSMRPGNYVLMTVADTGYGMDKETLSHVFEPFYTTKELGRGTGLGLSTVYGIIKQAEGHITVYSEEGRGTCFKVYLPAIDEAAIPAASDTREDESISGKGETILVVEDDPAVKGYIERLLMNAGYKIESVSRSSDALALFEEKGAEIDLLLTDVVMPEMGGRDLAEILSRRCPNVRALFMSGYSENAIAHMGILEEGLEFISKPFSSKDLLKKIRKILNG